MRSAERHQSAQSKLSGTVRTSAQRTVYKPVSECVVKTQKSGTVTNKEYNYLQFRRIDVLKETLPKTQSCLHLCQATAYLNFNGSLGILHVLQSCINIQCHYQPRCKPQRIIRFAGRLNDICSSSMELLGAKRLAKIRRREEEERGGEKKKKTIITVLHGEIVHELWILLDTARNY